MRLRLLKRSFVLGSLMCIASIGAGCAQLNSLRLPFNSGASVSTTPVAPPGGHELPILDKGGENHRAPSLLSKRTDSSAWPLQPGLFGVLNGMWLGWVSLVVGLFGIGSALLVSVQSGHVISQLKERISRHDKDVEKAYAAINYLSKRSDEDAARLSRLQSAYQQIEDKHAGILTTINSLRIQQRTEPQTYAVPMPNQIRTPQATQSYQPSPAEKQAELTSAVNRGDRQLVKSETCAHMNITHASENAISMGRLDVTQLEEVSAGGSYWAASFGGETWLYPTEQTLKGYTQTQRPTGIFKYTRQPISSAQVISPARLRLNGTLWQVAEMGIIAVPG